MGKPPICTIIFQISGKFKSFSDFLSNAVLQQHNISYLYNHNINRCRDFPDSGFLYPENPWLCQGFKEALAMSRKRKPPML